MQLLDRMLPGPQFRKQQEALREHLDAIENNTKKKKPDPAWDHMDRVLTLLGGRSTPIPGHVRVPGTIASGI